MAVPDRTLVFLCAWLDFDDRRAADSQIRISTGVKWKRGGKEKEEEGANSVDACGVDRYVSLPISGIGDSTSLKFVCSFVEITFSRGWESQ